MATEDKKALSAEQQTELLSKLKIRFDKNIDRHSDVNWENVLSKLEGNPRKLWSLYEMERTGGEPDVVAHDKNQYVFYDCAAESPPGRRSLCYDREGLESRKEHRPENSAIDMAREMAVEILTEQQYRHLQRLGKFDLKTSSWLATPPEIRSLGGAIYGDYRYGQVFIYHNGAQSYYAARGFRAALKV